MVFLFTTGYTLQELSIDWQDIFHMSPLFCKEYYIKFLSSFHQLLIFPEPLLLFAFLVFGSLELFKNKSQDYYHVMMWRSCVGKILSGFL